MIGIPRIITGKNKWIGFVTFLVSITPIEARTKPRNKLPVSPIKIVAL